MHTHKHTNTHACALTCHFNRQLETVCWTLFSPLCMCVCVCALICVVVCLDSGWTSSCSWRWWRCSFSRSVLDVINTFFVQICTPQLPPSLHPPLPHSICRCHSPHIFTVSSDHTDQLNFCFVPTISNAFICVIDLSVHPPFLSFSPALSLLLLLLYPVWPYCPAQSLPVNESFFFHGSQSGGLTLGFCAVHSTTCGL